jgi:hypothetical protein
MSCLTASIECSIIFGSPLQTQRLAGVATEIKMVCEDLAANAKVGSKPLDEALNKPHNSASLLLQTKRFARRESGESQRISVLTVL